MRDFGEALCVYKPPVDTRSVASVRTQKPNGNKEIVLNFITPHQKWGIHSTYTDNLIMLTLSRGGPIVWISEIDAGRPASSTTTGSSSSTSTARSPRARSSASASIRACA